jgi:hypothetical protein
MVKAHPQIPVIVTEGCKKQRRCYRLAMSVCLPGIRSGYRQPRDEFGQKMGVLISFLSYKHLLKRAEKLISALTKTSIKNIRGR